MEDNELLETLDDGLDLSTEVGVMEFCERHRARMVDWWQKEGRFDVNGFSFAAYVFATHEIQPPPEGGPQGPAAWKTGAKLDRVEAAPVRLPRFMSRFLPPDQETAAFAHLIGEYAKLTRAMGVMWAGETWLKSYDLTPEQKAAGLTPEEARKTMAKDLGDEPGRQEGLTMRLEHAVVGERLWCALITRHPENGGTEADTVGPWELLSYAGTEGRLVNLTDWNKPSGA